jgi:hypothetical protein
MSASGPSRRFSSALLRRFQRRKGLQIPRHLRLQRDRTSSLMLRTRCQASMASLLANGTAGTLQCGRFLVALNSFSTAELRP